MALPLTLRLAGGDAYLLGRGREPAGDGRAARLSRSRDRIPQPPRISGARSASSGPGVAGLLDPVGGLPGRCAGLVMPLAPGRATVVPRGMLAAVVRRRAPAAVSTGSPPKPP